MWLIDDLENSTDIVELVSKYTRLKKAWTNYKTVCPFPWHSEKTPSFVVSPSKQLAYCFWCHKWWWALKFIMDIENCEFKEAMEILSGITWKKIEWFNFNPEKAKITKNLYSVFKDVVNYYKASLKKYPEIEKYLYDRWLKKETIEKFNFWYADSWIELYNYLKQKWYDDKIISETNIFLDIKTKKDKFIWRVIFPLQNIRGDFIALAWRIIKDWEPKYLNSPASKIYDKSSILYWLYEARSQITKEDFVIITEGYMDTISLQEAGFFNTVAVSWTALTEKHITILKRLTNKIYLCFDNDKAWENATKLSLEMLKNRWVEVKIITLKWVKDPDEAIKKWKDFKTFIEDALSPIWYYIEKSNFKTDSIDEKKKLLSELIEILKSYSDNIEKSFYLKEIAEKLDIKESIIYDAFNKNRFKESDKNQESRSYKYSPSEIAIWIILLNNKNASLFKEKLIFEEEICKDLREVIEKGDKFLKELELEKKEKYRWISLELEDKDKQINKEPIDSTIENLSKQINLETYKKLTKKLKEQMASWDNESLKKYSEVIKKAKQVGIK